jgi:2-methylisocitrate lyase-like PEP mutase family enzyme
LQAFEKVGADMLYAPGLRDLATMRAMVQAIGKPLNVVMSTADPSLTAAEMEAVGVKRLSVGGARLPVSSNRSSGPGGQAGRDWIADASEEVCVGFRTHRPQ